jgi:hypothetical protein
MRGEMKGPKRAQTGQPHGHVFRCQLVIQRLPLTLTFLLELFGSFDREHLRERGIASPHRALIIVEGTRMLDRSGSPLVEVRHDIAAPAERAGGQPPADIFA